MITVRHHDNGRKKMTILLQLFAAVTLVI